MPARFVAAVDIGATNTRVVIANEDGEIEARRVMPTPEGAPEDAVRRIGRTIEDLIRGVWIGNRVAAAGVVLPGAVDPERGVVASVANMPGWDDVSIGAMLATQLGAPVALENDANAAAVGEGWRGAAAGMQHHVFIALGTGIGTGVVLNGRLHRGAHHLAGEVAYFRMTREQLRAGGWQECLEGVVGGRAALLAAREMLGEAAKTVDLFDAARSGDERATEWLRSTQEYLAMAVTDIIALLDPEAVVFGGGVVAAQGDTLLEPVRQLVKRCVPVPVAILQSTLDDDAQVIGAIKLALDKLEGT